MTTRIIVRNLALIKCLLAKNSEDNSSEIQQTLTTISFAWEQHMLQIRDCIEALEGIKDKEEAPSSKEQVASVIKNLHHLI
jgi:hypothetical protein